MSNSDYSDITNAFPAHIPLPRIERIHRAGKVTSGTLTLAEVTCAEDMPSRFLFGDYVPGSFKLDRNGWRIEYRGSHDSGFKLSVHDGRFEAKPRFLGVEGLSVGPANHRQAFGQLLHLATNQWDGVLKTHLENRYPVEVAPPDSTRPHAMHLPDGWLKTLFLPVSPEQLGTLFNWHMKLADDEQLAATQTGSVSLLFNSVNYIEGRCPEGWDDPALLLTRGLIYTNGPVVSQVVREEAGDGTAAWTSRRLAYLYRCNAFLRDVPRIIESLDEAGLISKEPDLIAGVAPSELCFLTKQLHWWSRNRECRVTWAWDDNQLEQFKADQEVDAETSIELIKTAIAAGRSHRNFFDLDNLIQSASSENK
jgi:hypothetical protein